jgi:hypothetical protein
MNDKYEELKKKYDLPKLEELEKNFDVDLIDEDSVILKEILKKMFDKIDFYTRTMESLLQPDSGLGYMKEASGLNPSEQMLVNKLYVEGMYMLRQFTEFGVEYDEKEAANFIKERFSEWLAMKPELKLILLKIKEVWRKEHKIETDKGYFG